MNRCHDIQGQLNDWLDDLLESAEQERVARHLQECVACRGLFERHQAISEDLQALGQIADRMVVRPRDAAVPRRSWQKVGRIVAAVLIVGTIGMGAVWYRSVQRAELIVHVPEESRQVGNLGDGHIGQRTATGRRAALIQLVKGDDRLAVRLPSKNPRVQIVWIYDLIRPKVETPGHEDEDASPSS